MSEPASPPEHASSDAETPDASSSPDASASDGSSPDDPTSSSSSSSSSSSEVQTPEVIVSGGVRPGGGGRGESDEDVPHDSVTEPAKVMRIGSMVKQLLEEVRSSSLDEASRERLAEVYDRSIVELSSALSPDLQEELRTLALPFEEDDVPSEAELRVAKAQLVGWLEGLFHGIQATLMAQQFAARQQLQEMRQLPGGQHAQQQPERPGTYL